MLKAISVLSLLMISAPSLAQASASSEEKKRADPNRIICERYEEIGSRLASRRVCKTARAWEEERRTQRADVERTQQNVGISQGN